MQKAFTYLLLFTYSTIILKPVLPFIKDGLAHILFFEEHMATVHAHNGKFHVHFEMQEAEKNENNRQSTNDILKKEISTSVHIVSDIIEFPIIREEAIMQFDTIEYKLTDLALPCNYPPPKA